MCLGEMSFKGLVVSLVLVAIWWVYSGCDTNSSSTAINIALWRSRVANKSLSQSSIESK